MPMTPPCINLSTAGMTLKLSKRTSTRSMTGTLQTSCKPMLRKLKPWSSLQNLYNPYPDLQLHLNNQAIERVSDITFLGIRISAKLSWNIHVDVISKKARQIIGLIHRNLHLAPEHLRHTLSITLVRPILEYSCATLHPLNKTLTNRLESVQRFVCRVTLQSWNLEHDFFLAHLFPLSKLVVTVQLYFRSSKFLPVSLLLPMSLFLTLVQIQDVTIPVRYTCYTSLFVA